LVTSTGESRPETATATSTVWPVGSNLAVGALGLDESDARDDGDAEKVTALGCVPGLGGAGTLGEGADAQPAARVTTITTGIRKAVRWARSIERC
jgi:hypothetical protein